MDLDLTDEQSMLRDTLASYLADHYDIEARRQAIGSDAGWRPDVWRAFAEDLGLFGAAFSEELGGFGGGAVENMIVMEQLGEALAVEPYLGTVVIAGGFLKHGGHKHAARLIGDIIAGRSIYAFAHTEPQGRYDLARVGTVAERIGYGWTLNGHKAVVVGAPWSTHFIVTARPGGKDARGVSLFLVERNAPGITTLDYRTIDGSRASDILFENVDLPHDSLIGREGEGLPLLERVIDEAIVAVAAEACGVMRRLHDGTIDYTRQRKQFGRPIADFQVLQHRMVDMFIQLERSVAMTRLATASLGKDAIERARAVSAAKVQVGKACRFVGQNAVQLHGGMGVTDELAIGHYFKRATVIEGLFGTVDYHLTRYERLSFGAV